MLLLIFRRVTHMTALTQGGLGACTMKLRMGAVIGSLPTDSQHDDSFSAKRTQRFTGHTGPCTTPPTASQEQLIHLHVTCRSRLEHGHQDDGDQRAPPHASTRHASTRHASTLGGLLSLLMGVGGVEASCARTELVETSGDATYLKA